MTARPRLLLTGGCGFIGTNLLPGLIAAGYRPVVFDSLAHAAVDTVADDVTLVRGDVRDPAALREASRDCRAVVHLAASGSVVDSVTDPGYNFAVNTQGTFNVLSAAREAGVTRFVFASTGGALMGDTPPPVDESSVPRPIAPYGASKLSGEGYCSAFAAAYGMQTVALRFANVYGPHSAHKRGVVTNFIKALHEGTPFTIFGDGSATRDFLHVRDLCQGILAALAAPLPGYTVMHLASGTETSMRTLAETLCELANRPGHRIEYQARRSGEVERNFADAALARKLIGFTPATTLREGLAETLQWFAGQRAAT